MLSTRVYWVGLGLVLMSLAWDDWATRTELNRLRVERASPIITATESRPRRDDCPVAAPAVLAATQPVPVSTVSNLPAIARADPALSQPIAAAVSIPPGTNLIDAIKLVQQQQQAQNKGPASAAYNPFGAAP